MRESRRERRRVEKKVNISNDAMSEKWRREEKGLQKKDTIGLCGRGDLRSEHVLVLVHVVVGFFGVWNCWKKIETEDGVVACPWKRKVLVKRREERERERVRLVFVLVRKTHKVMLDLK